MISRYSSVEMSKIWADENKFAKFLDVEIAACKAFCDFGVVPIEDLKKIQKNANFNLDRIYEIENATKHDVIAFTRCVSESLGEEKKWIHYGLTSTDVVDTANSLLLKDANNLIAKRIESFLNTLKRKAIDYKDIPVIGRTHGQHAEITSFGLKYALWYDELKRNYERLKKARLDVEVCKLSGAVGNFQTTTVEIEENVAKTLGLGTVSIATQVLSRDRHAFYIMTLALIASNLEKIAMEIRNLSQQEIHEVAEHFSAGQKGSSAMPHKRNPIGSENICGCSRVMRSYIGVALEDNILWSERDISHSSSERIILADSTTLIYYMLGRMNKIVEELDVFPENMLKNINLTQGVVFSGSVLNALIAKGKSREEAYDFVQKLSFEALETQRDLRKILKERNVFDDNEIAEIFNICKYLKNTDIIMKKVGIMEE